MWPTKKGQNKQFAVYHDSLLLVIVMLTEPKAYMYETQLMDKYFAGCKQHLVCVSLMASHL